MLVTDNHFMDRGFAGIMDSLSVRYNQDLFHVTEYIWISLKDRDVITKADISI